MLEQRRWLARWVISLLVFALLAPMAVQAQADDRQTVPFGEQIYLPAVVSPQDTTTGTMVSAATIQTVLNETFDDTSQFTIVSGSLFSDGGGDYFGLADGSGGGDYGAGSSPNALKAYTGLTGGFMTGMDLDGEGGAPPGCG